jgi:hypothetical protein
MQAVVLITSFNPNINSAVCWKLHETIIESPALYFRMPLSSLLVAYY